MIRSTNSLRKAFSVSDRLMYSLNLKKNQLVDDAETDPKRFDSPFEVKRSKPTERIQKVSTLENGIRVVSETPSIPGLVTLGVMLEVGTRHEDHESSGALFSINSTYYKSHLNTNEMINYNMVKMSGGKYDMEFNRETTVFKTSCLAHDVYDIFSMMSDCVLEPRSAVAANVAISKMEHLRKVILATNPGQNDTDTILSLIFGDSGLGMPKYGRPSNLLNLNSYTLQKFQIQNYSPKRMIIAGLGVENHGELVKLVREHFQNLSEGISTTQNQEFREIDTKTVDKNATKNELYIVFESVSAKHPDFIKSGVLRELFGSADVANPLCQLKNNGLFVTEIFNKDKAVYSGEAFNMNFRDTGLFGFRISSTPDNTNKAIDNLVKLIKSVEKMSEEDILGAKKRMIRRMIESVEDDYTRVNEVLSHLSYFGEFRLQQAIKEIEALSVKDIVAFLKSTVKGKTAVYVRGPNPVSVFNQQKIKEMFK